MTCQSLVFVFLEVFFAFSLPKRYLLAYPLNSCCNVSRTAFCEGVSIDFLYCCFHYLQSGHYVRTISIATAICITTVHVLLVSLTFIYMIIRMKGIFRAHYTSQHFNDSITNNLVSVHVCLCSGIHFAI